MSIYEQWGVEPIINACGTVTRLGGAPMPPQVLDAFRAAAADWVSLEQLQSAASRRIAAVTGAESGLVTSGAAGALTLGAAAILCGDNLGRMEKLPHCDAFPHEFLIAREQRSGYDHAVRASGARLVEVGFNEIVSNAGVRRAEAWEYASAITSNTAGIVYGYGADSRPPLPEVVKVARDAALPVLVDAAGELPPRGNLTAIIEQGADLVAFSGGKAIRGPQSTGILCGRRDLIASAALQMLDMDDHYELWDPPHDLIDKSLFHGHPRHGIGRALKVSKEEIAALLTALDLFSSGAYDELQDDHRGRLNIICDELKSTAATCRLIEPTPEGGWANLEIHIGKQAWDICKSLRNGSPPIYVGHGKLDAGILCVNPLCLDDASAAVLARRIREELA